MALAIFNMYLKTKTKWGDKMVHKEDRSKKFKILERDKNVINLEIWMSVWKYCLMSNTYEKV